MKKQLFSIFQYKIIKLGFQIRAYSDHQIILQMTQHLLLKKYIFKYIFKYFDMILKDISNFDKKTPFLKIGRHFRFFKLILHPKTFFFKTKILVIKAQFQGQN